MATMVFTSGVQSQKTLITHQEIYRLLIDQVRALYDAEHQLLKALPAMAKAASFSNLQELLDDHQLLTLEHIKRLENIFMALEVLPLRVNCPGMEGLVAEGVMAAAKKIAGPAKDALLISVAERIEHYEMACYDAVRSLAVRLDMDDIARAFEVTLEEGVDIDKALMDMGEELLNF